MNFRKVNNITGWIIGLLACMVYILTREASGSFWDCGEFVSSAYKVQMPHPPGAPLFVLLGRFFIILFGNNPQHAAQAVNLMSAVASGVTILFLFWTITHFARKMFVTVGEEMTSQQIFSVISAGVVGSLAYCFSDSFWFSAVEGEVYGLSSFFTALVFWAMLKWEHADEKAGGDELLKARADRWIVFIFFAMGLSVGVHLLNLLTIPAIVMIYYFRRYNYTTWGGVLAFVIGCIITGLVQVVIIQYSMKAAGFVDIYFVNNLKLGFFSGFAVYFIVVAAAVIAGLRFRAGKISQLALSLWLGFLLCLLFLPFILKGSDAGSVFKFLLLMAIGFIAYLFKPSSFKGIKLALWCYAFMMLGYFSYITPLIRSNANPAIDMNNVDNPMNLVYLLGREQYGEQPVVYGPHFVAKYKPDPESRNGVEMKKGEMKYVKGKNKYIPIGTDDEPVYESEDMQLFPRVWDRTNDQGHAQFYADWLDLNERDAQGNVTGYTAPTYGDNIHWFFTYQMGLMYWRYFMWNFAGKQNDVQGLGNVRDGNWLTGISFIDNQMLGDQSKMPDSSKNNKAHNTLYLLPFLLGILGCVFQFLRNRKDWVTTFLLFFFTGIAIVIYLNQPGNQPRERDYAFVGSFYAFAIWIGLAVPSLVKLVRETENKTILSNTIGIGAGLTFFIILMSTAWHTSFVAALLITALYALFVLILISVLRAISAKGTNLRLINIGAAVIGLIVPFLMAQQEWDDHDRSKKRLASDIARDYLESCAPNAILFTFGDNDTYPLWYAQEVEGVRPDIRIINNSLLGIDWYINQLRYKVNQSDSIDVIWTPEQIEGHNREYIPYMADSRFDANKYYSLYDVMKIYLGQKTDDPDTHRDTGPETFPVRRFSVPVDTAFARKSGVVNPKDTVVPSMNFELPMQGNRLALTKSDWIMLNIIAANNWKRPIYFTSPYDNLGFQSFLRKDGLTYRLVPVHGQSPNGNWLIRNYETLDNTDTIANKVLNKFVFTSKPGAYYDEENRRHALNLRSTYAESAGNIADEGKKDQALKILQKSESMINSKDLPYAMIGRFNGHDANGLVYLEACYKAGNMQLAEKVRLALKKDLEQQRDYYNYLKNEKEEFFVGAFDGRGGEAERNDQLLQLMDFLQQKYNPVKQPNPNERNQPTIINGVGADTNHKDSIKKP
jgi:hypothetical protein